MAYNDKEKKIQMILQIICSGLFAFLLFIVCNRRIYFVNDHYSSLAAYTDIFGYGGDISTAGSKYNILVLLNSFIYKLFGNSILTVAIMAIYQIIPCNFLAAFLASKDGKKVYWLSFPLLFFIFVPISGAYDKWIYHQWEALSFMLFLLIFDMLIVQRKNTKQLCLGIVLCILVTLYGMFYIGSILVAVYVIGPVAIYGLLQFLPFKENIIKIGKVVLYLLLFGLALFYFSGLNQWVYHGYGGSYYMNWTSVAELFNNFIKSIKFTAESWGIEFTGQSLIQGNAVVYLLKYVCFFYSLYLCVFYIVKAVKNKGRVHHPIDLLCSLCVVCNIGANVIGTCAYSGPDRYFSGAHYALAILFCRQIGRIFYITKNYEVRRQAKEIVAAILCLVVLAGAITPKVEKLNKVSDRDYQIADFLSKRGLQNGMGDFSNIFYFSPGSQGKVEAFSCYYGEGEIVRQFIIPTLYYEGASRYQFIYDYLEGDEPPAWNEESINKYYGDYIEKKEIENTAIYIYDYDIRWRRTMIDSYGNILDEGAQNSASYQLSPSKSIEYTFELPIGVSRIAVNGYGIQNLDIDFVCGSNVVEIIDEMSELNRISYDLSCDSNTLVRMKLSNNTERDINFKYADIRMVYAAKDLVKDTAIQASKTIEMPITTNDSDVTVIIKCDEAKKLELKAEDNSGIKINKIREGNIQSVYELSGLTEGQKNNLYLTNTSDNEAVIQKISYERNDIHQLYADQYNYDVRIIR